MYPQFALHRRCMNLKKHHWHSMAGMFIDRAALEADPLSVIAYNE